MKKIRHSKMVRPRGRPRKSEDFQSSHRVQIRLTDTGKEILNRVCKRLECSTEADAVRRCVESIDTILDELEGKRRLKILKDDGSIVVVRL